MFIATSLNALYLPHCTVFHYFPQLIATSSNKLAYLLLVNNISCIFLLLIKYKINNKHIMYILCHITHV